MVGDISAYKSQQSGLVIMAVMRKSQRANYAVMEIQNIRSINHNATRYLCTWRSIEKGDRSPEDETCNRVLRIPCNLSDLIESLSPSLLHGFPSGFSRNSLEFPFDLHSHLQFECRKIPPRNLPLHIGAFIEI